MDNSFLQALGMCLLLRTCRAVIGESLPPGLTVDAVNQTQASISWPPFAKVSSYYIVKAVPIYWFSDTSPRVSQCISYNNSKARLLGLQPGTHYNISVEAFTHRIGVKAISIWTEIGHPYTPPPVEIVSRKGTTLQVELSPGKSEKGPITGVQIIVLQKNVTFNEGDQLFNSSTAEEAELPYYITAVLKPEQLIKEFTIGDGKTYGGFVNVPLKEDASYEVLEGVVSSLNGITKVSYSPFSSDESMQRSAPVVLNRCRVRFALAIEILVFSFLIFMGGLISVHRKYHNTRLDEFVLNDHIEEVTNDFVPGAVHFENVILDASEEFGPNNNVIEEDSENDPTLGTRRHQLAEDAITPTGLFQPD